MSAVQEGGDGKRLRPAFRRFTRFAPRFLHLTTHVLAFSFI